MYWKKYRADLDRLSGHVVVDRQIAVLRVSDAQEQRAVPLVLGPFFTSEGYVQWDPEDPRHLVGSHRVCVVAADEQQLAAKRRDRKCPWRYQHGLAGPAGAVHLMHRVESIQ